MIAIIWMFLFFIGTLTFLLTGNASSLNKEFVYSINSGLDLLINILPGIVLWSGLMKISEDSLLLNNFAKLLKPLLKKLFPEVSSDHQALNYISSNIAANALGLGSVATPFGLKAMKELQKLNNNSKFASHSMQTFLVLNTAGVTIIPSMVITLRITNNSISPFKILLPSIVITAASCFFGIIINKYWRYKDDKHK